MFKPSLRPVLQDQFDDRKTPQEYTPEQRTEVFLKLEGKKGIKLKRNELIDLRFYTLSFQITFMLHSYTYIVKVTKVSE